MFSGFFANRVSSIFSKSNTFVPKKLLDIGVSGKKLPE